MWEKNAYIDAPKLAKKFKVGDRIRVYNPVDGSLSPWEGVVTAVLARIGFIDVETPYGQERFSAEEIAFSGPDPRWQDTSLSTYDREASRQARVAHITHNYLQSLTPLWQMSEKYSALSEMDRFTKLSSLFGHVYSDNTLRLAAQEEYTKIALYWKQKGRQYIPTKEEELAQRFTCPKCEGGVVLKKTTYRKHTKLFACPVCL